MSATGSDPAVPVSIAELFTIGIGPSSSHTVGPMRAARRFAALATAGRQPERVRCTLHGSLALTGKGHATNTAVLLGLAGSPPGHSGAFLDNPTTTPAEVLLLQS